MSRIALLGLPADLTAALTGVLNQDSHHVALAHTLEEVRSEAPDAVFVTADGSDFPKNLCRLREAMPRLPVVVVTRFPDTQRWIDALENGARDYCGAPFERTQLRWIMDTIVPPAPVRAAA
jgi:DNA-binding response OmpR family regulator